MAKTPLELAEDHLRREKIYNEERGILPSENRVIDRLLRRSDTGMREVYEELLSKLPDERFPRLWRQLLNLVLSDAAFANPERIQAEREANRRLQELNSEIAARAAELANLVRKRRDLAEQYSFIASEDYHPLHWLERAAERTDDREASYRFERWVKPQLERLQCQFDLKYWPSLPDLLLAVASFAEEARVETTDASSAAALASQKSSVADFLRVFLADLERIHDLPADFRFSDRALATIANCALDLGDGEVLDASDVKAMRQRDRKRGR